MTLVRSRYLMLSDRVYTDRSGRRARLAYSARRATLFALDEATADGLQSGDISERESHRLADLKALVPEQEDELGSVLQVLRDGSNDPATRGFTILVTGYCNMACGYCGQEHQKSAVDKARLERLATRVEATLHDPATRSVNVTWFGGEPLLALRVIRELSARFIAATPAGKSYSAQMATNGSLLTLPTLRMLHDCKVDSVEITIDGPEHVHNRRRLKRNGSGSYQHIVRVLGEALREQVAPRMRITIRVNIDAENQDSVSELLTDLAARGLAVSQLEFRPVPVHSWGNDVSAVELEARRYAALEMGWLRQAQELGFGLSVIPTVLKRTTCRATSVHGEIVDTQDRVYSCSEHPLVPGVRDTGVVATISDLAGSQTRPLGMYDDWYDQIEAGGQQCATCPLLPVCGGACPKLWREGHLPCPSLKFNWNERLDLIAERLGYTAQR